MSGPSYAVQWRIQLWFQGFHGTPLFAARHFLCTSSVQYAKSPCLRGYWDVWFQLLRATRYSIELPDSGIPRHFRGRVRVQYFRIFRMRINEWLRAHICRQLYSCVFCHGGGIASYVNVLMNNSWKRPSSRQSITSYFSKRKNCGKYRYPISLHSTS